MAIKRPVEAISQFCSVVGELARNKFAFLVSLDSDMNRFES
jgi:hypothetical protein